MQPIMLTDMDLTSPAAFASAVEAASWKVTVLPNRLIYREAKAALPQGAGFVFINVEFDNSAREMTVYSVASSDNPAPSVFVAVEADTGNARIISVADLTAMRADLSEAN